MLRMVHQWPLLLPMSSWLLRCIAIPLYVTCRFSGCFKIFLGFQISYSFTKMCLVWIYFYLLWFSLTPWFESLTFHQVWKKILALFLFYYYVSFTSPPLPHHLFLLMLLLGVFVFSHSIFYVSYFLFPFTKILIVSQFSSLGIYLNIYPCSHFLKLHLHSY